MVNINILHMSFTTMWYRLTVGNVNKISCAETTMVFTMFNMLHIFVNKNLTMS